MAYAKHRLAAAVANSVTNTKHLTARFVYLRGFLRVGRSSVKYIANSAIKKSLSYTQPVTLPSAPERPPDTTSSISTIMPYFS